MVFGVKITNVATRCKSTLGAEISDSQNHADWIEVNGNSSLSSQVDIWSLQWARRLQETALLNNLFHAFKPPRISWMTFRKVKFLGFPILKSCGSHMRVIFVVHPFLFWILCHLVSWKHMLRVYSIGNHHPHLLPPPIPHLQLPAIRSNSPS